MDFSDEVDRLIKADRGDAQDNAQAITDLVDREKISYQSVIEILLNNKEALRTAALKLAEWVESLHKNGTLIFEDPTHQMVADLAVEKATEIKRLCK